MKNIITWASLSLLLVCHISLRAQVTEAPSPIKWYTIDQVEELNKKQKRPLFIDVYTDWCGWCKHMMKTTFANKDIASYIQNNFYPVRYDAETTDTLVYKGKTYVNSDYLATERQKNAAEKAGKKYQATRNKFTHDLAKEILGGRLSYPTIVYVDKQGTPNPVPGFMDVNKIQPFLVYFAEDVVGNANFEEFNTMYYYTFPKTYKKEIRELKDEKVDTSGTVKWYTFAEAKALNAKEPRKFFIDLFVNYKTTCKVMDQTTYKNPEVAKVLNEKFYPIRLDGMSKEEIDYFGQKLINEGKQHPFHQLAVEFAVDRKKNQILFPTLVFLDENNKFITKVQNYLPPKTAAPFFDFIAGDAYKTEKWQEFYEKYTAQK